MGTSPVFFRKDVVALPSTLQPNTVYFVRVGAGFDLYLSDSTGAIAHPINKPTPSQIGAVTNAQSIANALIFG